MRRQSLDLTEPARNIEESNGQPFTDMADTTADRTLSPPAEEMELVDGEGGEPRVHTPPPHIAARLFYRPMNQTRRKDSAASSRRNSISSATSRSSHGGVRS